jgi:hypothetical protein
MSPATALSMSRIVGRIVADLTALSVARVHNTARETTLRRTRES